MREVDFGRRRLLSYAGWTAAGLVALGGCASPRPASQGKPAPPVRGEDHPIVRTEYVHSEHRRTSVQLLTAHPSQVDSIDGLPVVLYLHGRDGVQPSPIPQDTLAALEREHRAGSISPFGLVAVDGGYNPYWSDGSANGDLLRMLTDEVPAWLRERGLGDADGRPFAVAGISTGGFGALHYAVERSRAGEPLDAVAALAPALPVTWEHMREKNAFDTEQDWYDNDPLQHLGDLGDLPVGVWIGDADAFLDGSMRLVAEHENTPVVSVLPGGHDESVFDVVGADMVRYLSENVPSST